MNSYNGGFNIGTNHYNLNLNDNSWGKPVYLNFENTNTTKSWVNPIAISDESYSTEKSAYNPQMAFDKSGSGVIVWLNESYGEAPEYGDSMTSILSRTYNKISFYKRYRDPYCSSSVGSDDSFLKSLIKY